MHFVSPKSSLHVCTRAYGHTILCIHMYVYAYVFVCEHICICACLNVYLYVHVFMLTRGNLPKKGAYLADRLQPSLREGKARTEQETMEEFCLLVCSPWLAQTAFLYSLGPKRGTAHSEVDLPPSVISQ